jgi:hypothetical protein
MAKAKVKRKTSPAPLKRGVARKKLPPPVLEPELLGKDLERAVERFQSEPDEMKAHRQWKKIEASVFGVQFED